MKTFHLIPLSLFATFFLFQSSALAQLPAGDYLVDCDDDERVTFQWSDNEETPTLKSFLDLDCGEEGNFEIMISGHADQIDHLITNGHFNVRLDCGAGNQNGCSAEVFFVLVSQDENGAPGPPPSFSINVESNCGIEDTETSGSFSAHLGG